MEMTRDEFVAYLRETLIPDLRADGRHATASDFEAAILFIEGAREVDIREEGALEVGWMGS
jgi:hypothetical protein